MITLLSSTGLAEFKDRECPGQPEARDHPSPVARGLRPLQPAILVRPDRFIAWRSPAGSGEPRAALAVALSQILARPVDAPVAWAV